MMINLQNQIFLWYFVNHEYQKKRFLKGFTTNSFPSERIEQEEKNTKNV